MRTDDSKVVAAQPYPYHRTGRSGEQLPGPGDAELREKVGRVWDGVMIQAGFTLSLNLLTSGPADRSSVALAQWFLVSVGAFWIWESLVAVRSATPRSGHAGQISDPPTRKMLRGKLVVAVYALCAIIFFNLVLVMDYSIYAGGAWRLPVGLAAAAVLVVVSVRWLDRGVDSPD